MTTKGQTTLPRDVRAALGLKSGDKVRHVVLDGEVRLLKARPGKQPVSLDEMDDAISSGAIDGLRPKQ